MAKYSKEANYADKVAANIVRDDYNCPCCGRKYKLSDCKLEKVELFRETVVFPRLGTMITYAGYRMCPKCFYRRELTFKLPFRLGIIFVIIAVISTVAAFCINPDKYGLSTLGLWMLIATPLWIICWLVPNLIFWRASTFRNIDFDKALDNNAVDWHPHFKEE